MHRTHLDPSVGSRERRGPVISVASAMMVHHCKRRGGKNSNALRLERQARQAPVQGPLSDAESRRQSRELRRQRPAPTFLITATSPPNAVRTSARPVEQCYFCPKAEKAKTAQNGVKLDIMKFFADNSAGIEPRHKRHRRQSPRTVRECRSSLSRTPS